MVTGLKAHSLCYMGFAPVPVAQRAAAGREHLWVYSSSLLLPGDFLWISALFSSSYLS